MEVCLRNIRAHCFMKHLPRKSLLSKDNIRRARRLFALTVCLLSIFFPGGRTAADAVSDVTEEIETPILPDTGVTESEYSYTLFENGNFNHGTGNTSNANKKPIRTRHFISVGDFIAVKINRGFYVRVFAYDSTYTFLGAIVNKTSIDYQMTVSRYPLCEYVKILAVSRDGTRLEPDSIEEYGLSVRLKAEYPKRNELLDMGDITAFGSNGIFTHSFDVIIDPKNGADRPTIITCKGEFRGEIGEAYPSIQLRLINDDDKTLYYSPVYRIADKNRITEKQWRAPLCQNEYNRIKISVIIPEGAELLIEDFYSGPDSGLPADDSGILFHAHQGFYGLCGASTLYSFKMAGEMGYRSCITIPKFTSDGVCVCFHDDSTIRQLLRYPDGSRIEEGSEDDKPISGFTYNELMRFDAGIKKNKIFAAEKVPTLEQFFSVCSQYGMAPVLSIHSGLDWWGDKGIARFACIRELAEKAGVLDQLRIKTGSYEVQRAARIVFDHDIAGYILLQGQSSVWDPLYVAKESGFVAFDATSMDESDYFVVMEYFYAAATDEKIRLALDEGFPVSIATTGNGISGPELERLINMGITEFSIDHHCSMGLNW